ncbi:hypothetical protein [Piscinibacter sp. XHJ-5]|uniref:hypothetical protein n=1 Tax=Piscinibacter sp. XHJ-5 TaxID=3037797 RepID=UPI002452C093|nr:hypothetical protein [Piscinibacter sp. XHJ-5]
MTMSNLISKRMAQGARMLQRGMNGRSSLASDSMEAAASLDGWEAEGGAEAGMLQAPEDERLLLERLGAALVGEWNNLPAPLQRAVYERAVGAGSSWNRLPLRRRMARFLHDHKSR